MLQTINGTNLVLELDDSLVKNSDNSGAYLDRIKEINRMPLCGIELFFSDDIWDFTSACSMNINKSDLAFRFESVNEHFRNEIKKYVLYQLIQGIRKVQTIHIGIGNLVRFFNFASNLCYYKIHQFTPELIKSFMSQLEPMSKSYRRNNIIEIRKFLLYYSSNYKDIFTSELERVLDANPYKLNPVEKERRKYSDIPKEYFTNFLKAAVSIIESEDASPLIKACTCILIILSQTGLRISEILDLRCGSLQKLMSHKGSELAYIHYRTWKREQGNNAFATEKVFANSLTIKAYELLIDIYHEARTQESIEYLYLGRLHHRKNNTLPVSRSGFTSTMREVFIYMNKYFPTINLPKEKRDGLSNISIQTYSLKKRYPEAETLTYPSTPQFRVHACTELYANGCPLAYIQKFMGHLSNEMAGYYVRVNPHNTQEDINYARDVFKKIVRNEVTILGPDAENFKSRIDLFIQENRYHIERDMDAILSMLTAKMPVRQKTGGVCIRSSAIRECSKDAMTNEFYCAYGVCPNIYHFFYMANVSYRQAQELLEGLQLNKKRGFMRQAYKEALMLRSVAAQKLIPELAELQKELRRRNVEQLIKEYPDLEYIVNNIGTIQEAAEQWKEYNI